ncbi:MAG: histidine--tRNA ligase [Thermodesulfobacteriota bacterium]
MTITAIRGFNDIMPAETAIWLHIEEEARRIFRSYGFSEIRIPLLERTELFKKSIGETTDIVEKEMYTFTDRHGDSLTLRPEGTAPVVRAYIEHKLYKRPISKLYYMGPMFRYERPQRGRYRQFYQIGAEVLSEGSPKLDAEVLEMLMALLKSIGLKGATLNINSLGCRACRPQYKEKVKKFLETRRKALCENCLRRIKVNPLRALDCKSTGCKDATVDVPSILDTICNGCKEHFEEVKRHLSAFDIHPSINPRMVRGLDYYTKTTFEITAEGLGAQNAVVAGGRYDRLVQDLGGPDTPCFGFAIGMERLVLIMKDKESVREPLFFVAIFGGSEVEMKGAEIIKELRDLGFAVEREYAEKGIKAQMKKADKIGASFVLLLGEDEHDRGVVAIKDMKTGSQKDVKLGEIVEELNKELSTIKKGE